MYLDIESAAFSSHLNISGSYSESYIHITGLNWSQTRDSYDWCSGSGSFEDPYIIENVSINANNQKSGIFIENSSVYSIIRNNFITNSASGINPTYYGGIEIKNSLNIIIEKNNFSYNNGFGIYIQQSSNIIVSKNDIEFNNYSGIYIINSKNNTINSNRVNDNFYGLLLKDNNETIIQNNTFNRNFDGIYLNGQEKGCNNNLIEGNYIKKNNFHGIYVTGYSYNNSIINNIIINNSLNGIYLIRSINNMIKNNIIANNTDNGIFLFINSKNNNILSNSIINNGAGILLSSNSDENIFSNNLLYSNKKFGVLINTLDSSFNLFSNNNFSLNILNAKDNGTNNFWNNSFIGNFWDDYSEILEDVSDIDDDGIGDIAYNISGMAGSIDYLPIWDDGHDGTELHIDGKGINGNNWDWYSSRKWISGSGTLLNPYLIKKLTISHTSESFSILIENSNKYFVLKNCIIINLKKKNHTGIYLINVSNGKVTNNIVSSNFIGMFLKNSSHNNITSNYVLSNNDMGLYLLNSSKNILFNNTIESNFIGLYLLNQSNFNNITKNNFFNNNINIKQLNCFNNIFKDNKYNKNAKIVLNNMVLTVFIFFSFIVIVISAVFIVKKKRKGKYLVVKHNSNNTTSRNDLISTKAHKIKFKHIYEKILKLKLRKFDLEDIESLSAQIKEKKIILNLYAKAIREAQLFDQDLADKVKLKYQKFKDDLINTLKYERVRKCNLFLEAINIIALGLLYSNEQEFTSKEIFPHGKLLDENLLLTMFSTLKEIEVEKDKQYWYQNFIHDHYLIVIEGNHLKIGIISRREVSKTSLNYWSKSLLSFEDKNEKDINKTENIDKICRLLLNSLKPLLNIDLNKSFSININKLENFKIPEEIAILFRKLSSKNIVFYPSKIPSFISKNSIISEPMALYYTFEAYKSNIFKKQNIIKNYPNEL